MPLLARMLPVPMAVHIAPGAIGSLGELLADRRISAGGHVAVAVGQTLGGEVGRRVQEMLPDSRIITLPGAATVDAALELAETLRQDFYDAVVGIGGGGTLDVAKHAATLVGLPMVSVATSVSHDGIASPVSSLKHSAGKTSFGVQMPVAVVVDLDYVLSSPLAMRRAGIGDVLSNLTALADWRLANRERGEPLDGLAAALADSAATAVSSADGSVDCLSYLSTLAQGLVLSGLAMAIAGSSRPCSGADHEIVHAIDHLYADTALHGEVAGVGAAFTAHLHQDMRLVRQVDDSLRRHGLPRNHRELGLTDDEFVRAVAHAPSTRPGRFTILEHLALDEQAICERVRAYVDDGVALAI